MNPVQDAAFRREIALARAFIAKGELESGWPHLERAHVIGQDFVVPHATAHWWMLRVELRRRRPRAVAGQAVRIVLGALGSAVGVVPTGNTGGSDVSMLRRMPIDPELRDIIAGVAPGGRVRRSPGEE